MTYGTSNGMMKLQRKKIVFEGTNLIGGVEAADAPFGYMKYERLSGSNMPPRHNSVKIRFNSLLFLFREI